MAASVSHKTAAQLSTRPPTRSASVQAVTAGISVVLGCPQAFYQVGPNTMVTENFLEGGRKHDGLSYFNMVFKFHYENIDIYIFPVGGSKCPYVRRPWAVAQPWSDLRGREVRIPHPTAQPQSLTEVATDIPASEVNLPHHQWHSPGDSPPKIEISPSTPPKKFLGHLGK